MNNNEIKHREAKQLNAFLDTLTYRVENPERTDPVRQVLIDPLKLF